MIAFGGAAPLHAGSASAKNWGFRTPVWCPAGAGVGSAIGFLRAPFSFEATRSQFMRLSRTLDRLWPPIKLLWDLSSQLRPPPLCASCDAQAEIQAQYKVYMRYSGQGWEIPVPFDAATLATISRCWPPFQALFEREYRSPVWPRLSQAMDMWRSPFGRSTPQRLHARSCTAPGRRGQPAPHDDFQEAQSRGSV